MAPSIIEFYWFTWQSFSERDWKGVSGKLFFSEKAVPVNVNMKFMSKFNCNFTNRGCFRCAILKALYDFKEKIAHKARDMHSFFQNVQN